MSYTSTQPPFLIGAYASTNGELDSQEEYYELLAAEPWVGGLEVPYLATGLREDPAWFAERMAAAPEFAVNVLTPIPGVMSHIADRTWGIASRDRDGRAAALAFLRAAADTMCDINDRLGRRFFHFLALHTAPQKEAHSEALLRSLEELLSWDIDGAALTIEHCDAWSYEHPVEKGFLQLREELAVIAEIGEASTGGLYSSLNWGRSAIEGRSADLPLEHIQTVAASGYLGGMILSGAQDRSDGMWGPWVDAHIGLHEHQPESVLTEGAARQAFAAALAGNPRYIGAKISISTGANSERIARLRELAALAGRA
ncbi:MAG: DUF4862 family protein [Arcanobacterium sp.]|nr:DUF4862 family protein [Arcanobacterium sp.]